MKILVRLPNWLGDMVMSVGLMNQLPHFFPGAEVSVIAKKGIHELLDFFPPINHAFIFSKDEFPGIKGLLRFGREIKEKEQYDLYISMPNSLSTALSGWATGARKRIGYRKELRQVLLTKSFPIPKGLHRVEEYIRLLELYTGKKAAPVEVSLHNPFLERNHIVVNINSEASSRRLTVDKGVEVIRELRRRIDNKIILIGAPKEKDFIEEVLGRLEGVGRIESVAGKTTLPELVEIIGSSRAMLSTDSGPAHLANALGVYTVVLFGAGNELHTAPYNVKARRVIRLGQLSCEPCEKNICLRYGIPQCLTRLNSADIAETLYQQLLL